MELWLEVGGSLGSVGGVYDVTGVLVESGHGRWICM